MSDLPPELRDRAARAAMSAHTSWSKRFVYEGTDGPVSNRWNVVVDAVAEVLAGHVGCEHLDGPYRRLVVERDDLRVRAERAEADLARAARSVSPDPTTALSGPAGAAHTEEET